ncbi:ABC transporter substrate-binding protein [Mesorhizobium shangrilense]|uniref:Extracellular solute-binding protein n=1 Tax=Mesorhizobium shangrilense TaxID=460060 RepID=A0ABV2DE21_9HYPH
MLGKKWLRIPVAGLAILTSTAVYAQSVQLFHDKGFWSDQLKQVGVAAKAKTGVEIVETPYAPAEQYKAFIQSSISAGNTPDMFTWWTGKTFKDLVDTEQIAPLDDVWDKLIASGQYDPSIRDLFKVGDHAYGVPLELARWVVLYNKKMFKDAGISEPKTWADLIADADKLKAAGHTPFNITVQEGWRGFIWFEELMIRTNPAAYKGLHNGTVAYDSPEVRKVFQLWSDMYAKGYFVDPRSQEEAQDFARGKAAMYLTGEWAEGIVDKAGLKPDSDFGAFIMPNVDPSLPSAVIVEASPIVVSNTGKAKKDVLTALDFFVSKDGANSWGKASGNYLGNLKADAPNPLVAKVTADMGSAHTQLMDRWWEAVPPDLQGELVALLNGFMLDPTMKNADTVMTKMQALNAAYWAKNK